MNLTSIGDLAQSLVVRNQSAQMKRSIATLTQELTTGQTTRVAERVGGDYSYLSDIDRNLSRLDGYAIAASEAGLSAGAVQNSLGRLHDIAGDLSKILISVPAQETPFARRHAALQAKENLGAAISALNVSVAGRSLFSGTATTTAPLAPADDLLDRLRTVTSGLTDADDIVQAARDWFADPAGFVTEIYQGADTSLAPTQIGPQDQVGLPLRADDPALRDVLMNIALAALAAEPGNAHSADVQEQLISRAGGGMLNDQDRLASMRADVGFVESRIDQAATRNASARTGFEMARATLLEGDPFETATRLEETQFQLESLYAVTVRSSRLSLLGYMK